ncbi:hypothetical protein ACFL2H_07585 [Planctomycetota bacterium]
MNDADVVRLFVFILVAWLIFGAMAAHIASIKEAKTAGFWFGFLLGPFGVLAAGFLDKRAMCPNCGGRLNGQFAVCQHCGIKLDWTYENRPMTPNDIETLHNIIKSVPVRDTAEFDGEHRHKFDEWGNPLKETETEATLG